MRSSLEPVLDVDPKDLAFFNYFNAGVGAANIDNITRYLDCFSDHLKLVVIGLDFMQFNETFFPPLGEGGLHFYKIKRSPDQGEAYGTFENIGLVEELKYLFDADALRQALLMIYDRRDKFKQEIILYPAGNFNKPSLVWQMQNIENTRTRDEIGCQGVLDVLQHHNYADFKYSTMRVAELEHIKEMLARKHVKLVVFINPMSARDAGLVRDMGLTYLYTRFTNDIVHLFGVEAAIPAYEYSDLKYYYDFDPLHFLPSTGAEVINRMVANSFGLTLTPDFQVWDRVVPTSFVASSSDARNPVAFRPFNLYCVGILRGRPPSLAWSLFFVPSSYWEDCPDASSRSRWLQRSKPQY
jgi:hypothetical protein